MAEKDSASFQAFELKFTMADQLTKSLEQLAGVLDTTKAALVGIADQAAKTGVGIDKTASASEKVAKSGFFKGMFVGPASQKSPFQLAASAFASREIYRGASSLVDMLQKWSEFELDVTRRSGGDPTRIEGLRTSLKEMSMTVGGFRLDKLAILDTFGALIRSGDIETTDAQMLELAKTIEMVRKGLGGTTEQLTTTAVTLRNTLRGTDFDERNNILARFGLMAREVGISTEQSLGLVDKFKNVLDNVAQGSRAKVMMDLVAGGSVLESLQADPEFIRRFYNASDITDPEVLRKLGTSLANAGLNLGEVGRLRKGEGSVLDILGIMSQRLVGEGGRFFDEAQTASIEKMLSEQLGLSGADFETMRKLLSTKGQAAIEKARGVLVNTQTAEQIVSPVLAEAKKTFAGAWANLQASFEGMIVDIVSSGTMTKLVDVAEKAINWLADFFNNPGQALLDVAEAVAQAIKRVIMGGRDYSYYAGGQFHADQAAAAEERKRRLGIHAEAKLDMMTLDTIARNRVSGYANMRSLTGSVPESAVRQQMAHDQAELEALMSKYPLLKVMEAMGKGIADAATCLRSIESKLKRATGG